MPIRRSRYGGQRRFWRHPSSATMFRDRQPGRRPYGAELAMAMGSGWTSSAIADGSETVRGSVTK